MNEPRELTVDECLDHLAGEVLGRLAIVTPDGPRIVPLNYALVDDTIVLRTTAYSEVTRHALDKQVAFEVDSVDHARQTGWSVVVIGTLGEPTPAEMAGLRNQWVPQPWAGGVRNRYLQLRWREVTGRRLGDLVAVPPRRVL